MRSKRTSIAVKLYIFIIVTVLAVSVGTAILAYRINADQIDRYYKQVSLDSARNFASLVDGDYLAQLRKEVESDEYQALRETAEENDDESVIRDYLEQHGLWDGYVRTRASLMRYLNNMDAVKYLYLVAWGGPDALYDMYLVDDEDNPLYETGYYEEREEELRGIDASKEVEPTISTGDWGWLCSAYVPVYDSKGELVCQAGCDFGMDDVMAERHRALMYTIAAAVVLTGIALIFAVLLINRLVVSPLNSLTAEMKKFRPSVNADYEEAGVADLKFNRHDEIDELYNGIRSMQVNIVDYLNDMELLQKDKEKAEEDIRTLDEQIGQISKEVYVDVLTGVGSKAAYIKMSGELSRELREGDVAFGIVMVDMNDLKKINDEYGHRNGDLYIKGCCRMICDCFKHSPVYRIGGDEFVVILQGPDYDNRLKQVEELKNSYAQSQGDQQAEPWERFSAAVGMAELASDDYTVDLVFKRADKAMYMDKQKYKKEHGTYR